MDVSENSGFSPQNHPLKNRVFHYFHHPFWWFSPYFWKHPYISGVMHMKYSANSKRLFICSWRLMVDTFQAWRISCGGWYRSKILPRERSNFRKFEMCAALNDHQSASNSILQLSRLNSSHIVCKSAYLRMSLVQQTDTNWKSVYIKPVVLWKCHTFSMRFYASLLANRG